MNPAAINILLVNVFATDFALGLVRVALGWSALQQFGGFGLGAVVLATSAGQFVGSVVAGRITDAIDRRRVARDATFIGGIGFALLALALAAPFASLALVCAATALAHMILAVQDNAARTMIPALVGPEGIERANGHFITIGQIGFFAAPLAAGWATALSGAQAVILASVVFCLLGGAAIMALRPIARPAAAGAASGADASGVDARFLRKHPWLVFGLTLAVIVNLLLLPITLVLVPVRIESAGLTAVELGYFYAALSAGFALAGLIGTERLVPALGSARLSVFIALAALTYATVVHFHLVAVVVLCGALVGFFLAQFEIGWSSIMQRRSPSAVLGRVYALGSWTSFAARSAGVFLVGAAVVVETAQTLVFLLIAATLALVLAATGWYRHAAHARR